MNAVTRAKAGEALSLAEAMMEDYRRRVRYFRRECGLPTDQALERAEDRQYSGEVEKVLEGPVHMVTWQALADLAEIDPERATQRWEELKLYAQAELECGSRAAKVVEAEHAGPWERAQFQVLREALTADWKPTGATEWMLIDTLAQAYTEQERWLRAANVRLGMECDRHRQEQERRNAWIPPRVTEAEAVEQAMAMVERWNRMVIRTLRALRDLRRYNPMVVVQNAGQVNVGAQQLNVADTNVPAKELPGS